MKRESAKGRPRQTPAKETEFSLWLLGFMERTGRSIGDVVDETGADLATVYRWRNGEQDPGAAKAIRGHLENLDREAAGAALELLARVAPKLVRQIQASELSEGEKVDIIQLAARLIAARRQHDAQARHLEAHVRFVLDLIEGGAAAAGTTLGAKKRGPA